MAAGAGAFDERGEACLEPHGPGDRAALADHLPVQRVGQPHVVAAVARGDPDQAALLGALHRCLAGRRDQQRQPDRLAERDKLDHLAHLVTQVADAGVDQVGEAGRQVELAGPAPHPVQPGELVSSRGGDHQLAQQQWVARREAPEAVGRGGVDRTAEHLHEQRAGVGGGERGELVVVDKVVGPQCPYGQRHLLAGAQRAKHGRVRVAGDKVDKCGGRRVEQVRVVDREHHRAARGLGVQRVDGPPQQAGR
ncbi:hypothetical protein Pflav_060780 [Phytohabitans flavus]|uniref:Uncharacterized protein n=1 Tax=Phytohabitans flavus TaxID=1076124 RepID=A0A6F8Y117_9ACTN|nr:hypothetical protein Pflav_060780 [Phytohabitans flavus]